MVTRTPDSSLPSFHLAMQEEPYRPGSRGFGAYPRTKYVWVFDLARPPGIDRLRIHRGKDLLVTERVAQLVDPLARRALADAEAGAHGEAARRVVEHLAAAGPTLVEELKEELALDAACLRSLRGILEPKGAIVARGVVIDAPASSTGTPASSAAGTTCSQTPAHGGLDDLVVAGVAAALVAPEDELRRWFSWSFAAADVDRVVDEGRPARPGPGLVALR